MQNVLIINAYQTHVASKGKLTATLIKLIYSDNTEWRPQYDIK